MSDFRKLKVYGKAHAMMLDAHTLAEKIKGVHHASLKNQIVRAAMSVPTNIVEGCGQRSTANALRPASVPGISPETLVNTGPKIPKGREDPRLSAVSSQI